MDLSELGLTPSEQRIYQTLVKHGSLTASTISREAEVSYGKIYEVLDRLEAKGLVKVIPEKTKKFTPTEPENLNQLIKEKQDKLKRLQSDVKDLQQIYKQQAEEPVLIAKGKANFDKIAKEMKRGDTFVYNVKPITNIYPSSQRSIRRNKERGINFKSLNSISKKSIPNLKKWLTFDKESTRSFDNDSVAMAITDHDVMIGLIEQNTTILIRDKEFIRIIKIFFENTYNLQEPITEKLLKEKENELKK